MLRTSRWLAVTALCAFVAAAPAAPVPGVATDSPLAVVPAQAPIVVQIRGIERVKDRLNAMLKEAVPDVAPIAGALMDSKLTDLLNGRSLAAAEKGGPVFVAFLEMPSAEVETPPLAIIAKVTKYSDFKNGMLVDDEKKTLKSDPAGFEKAEVMGKDVYFVDKGEYAVMTPSKDVATLMTKKQPGLDTKMSVEMAKKLTGNDLAIYVNMTAINKVYGDTIRNGKDQFFDLLDQMGGALDKSQLDAAKAMYGGMFQLLEDGKAMVFGFDFKPDGFGITMNAQVGTETKTNQLLKDMKPGKLEDMSKLTAGYTTYSGAQFGPAFVKAMSSMIFGVAPVGDAKKLLETAVNDMIAAGNTSAYSGTNFPSQGLSVQAYKDPQKAVEAQIKMYEALGEGGQFQNSPIKGKAEIKQDVGTYKGFKLNYVRVEWDLDKLTSKIPNAGEEAKAAIKKLIGDDMKIWFGTDGTSFVTATAKDEAAAKAMIDAYVAGGKTLGSEPAFAATRKNLPEMTTMVMMADANRFTQVMGDYMLSIMQATPLPIQLPKGIKPVKGNLSFLGMALTMQPEYGSIDIFIPTEAVKEIRKVVESAMAGAGQ